VPRIDNAIDVRAPKEKVFAYVADVRTQPEWVKWAKKVELTSAEPGLGATDTMLMQVGPRREQVESIVTEFRDGHVVTRRTTKGMKIVERLATVAVADGTKVAWSIEYTPPMGPMGKMMDFLFMSTLFNQLMEDSLELLKERLEQTR
jgi:uncharacterized membrane protein